MALSGNLLALPTAAIIAIVVAGVLVVGSLVYGAFRKFSRMSWACWQLPILFALFLLFDVIPLPGGANGYAIVIGGALAMIAVVLGIGAIIRGRMRARTTPAHIALRVIDRILGVLTALLNWVVAALVFGGFFLAIVPQIPALNGALSFLDVVYNSAVWGKIGAHAADLLLIAFLMYAVKAGYRLGIGRFLWAGVTLLLSFVAVFGAIYLVLKVPFLIALANKLAALFTFNAIAGWVLGRGIAAIIVFLVFFVLIILLSLLINLLFNKINRVRALNVIAGILLALLFYVVAAAFVTGLDFGIAYLAEFTAGAEGYLAVVGKYVSIVGEILGANGIIGFLYTNNPLSLLL